MNRSIRGLANIRAGRSMLCRSNVKLLSAPMSGEEFHKGVLGSSFKIRNYLLELATGVFPVGRLNVLTVLVCAGVFSLAPGVLEAQSTAGMGAAEIQSSTIMKVTARGNAKVESDAILTLLETKAGGILDSETIKNDILTLFDLGYFSSIQVLKKKVAGGQEIIIDVSEKPAIVSIEFEGLEEVSEEDVTEKMETIVFKILNEGTITADIRMIEALYVEKGFYLAKVSYTLEEKSKDEVALKFIVDEKGKVLVGDVSILGNEYFSDADIISKFASQPHTRGSAISSSSLYQDAKVSRDLGFLSYYYRDQGFAEVKVAKPISFLDSDREFVRLTFQVEEGIQYNVGKITITGDLLYPEDELLEQMMLKPGGLFRHSWFARNDIELLVNKYRDLGYAYADINPKTALNRDKKTVDINYVITKGEKIYFGEMVLVGNTKTRDNVIRREMLVADAGLFNGSDLRKSKANITRLGFFEEVQIIEQRNPELPNILDLKVRVKEAPTGQLQMSVGFNPGGATKATWFGQGKYTEKNQSGKGWNTSFTGKITNSENYRLDLGFSDPRVDDSYWSLGVNGGYEKKEARFADTVTFSENKSSLSVTVGRKIIELIRGYISLIHSETLQNSEQFILRQFRSDGARSSAVIGLSRKSLDNFLDPSSGTAVSISQKFTGGWLGGDYSLMETVLDSKFYFPIDFSESYRTYFKFHTRLGLLWQSGDSQIPSVDRYRLGGLNDLRAFDYASISPRYRILTTPGGGTQSYTKGGDKQLYFQLEYFFPLIPEAKIKGLLFTDVGRVFDDPEELELTGFAQDVGFGLRWITPIAPFRFEWAFPVKGDGSLGEFRSIFNIGL